jgi:hypothetical protein
VIPLIFLQYETWWAEVDAWVAHKELIRIFEVDATIWPDSLFVSFAM